MLLFTGLGRLTENSQKLAGLSFANLTVTVINFLELSDDLSRLNLEQDDEEEEFGKGDLAVIISIDTVENLWFVILQIVISALEEFCVTVGSHGSEEVLVGHAELAILRLFSGKDFVYLFWWAEETNLVLVVATDAVFA